MLDTKKKELDIVIDTDTFNEVDDQFALAYAMRSPELHIKGIYAAPFLNAKSNSPEDGMLKSYDEILKVLSLAEREDLLPIVKRGCTSFLENEESYVKSDAVEHLIAIAKDHTPENPLYVVGLAVLTDIASAIVKAPEIVPNIVVVWLGGHSREYENTLEFNMRQDIAAARVVFQSEVKFVQIPCRGVASHFSTTKPEMDHWIVGKNPLATYLAINAVNEASTYAEGKPWSRVIWDVTAIAWLLNEEERFLKERTTKRNLPSYDGTYSYPMTDLMMQYVYYVNRDALFEDLFRKLAE